MIRAAMASDPAQLNLHFRFVEALDIDDLRATFESG
jgi:hypothetical protein